MATTVKKAEAEKPEAVDLEAVKAQAVADYKNRVASIEGVFEGLEISAEDRAQFIDGEKTVAEATEFALAKAKEKLAAQAEDLKKVSAERDEFKTKAENAEKNPAAGLSEEQKRLVKAGLEHESSAQNGVPVGGDSGAANDKLLKEAYAAGARLAK